MNRLCPGRDILSTGLRICLQLGVLLLAAPAVIVAQAEELRLVVNPYEGITWEHVYRLKSGFHCHTVQSDGGDPPEAMIDEYRRHGFQVLAITDHNRCTWPWENWGRNPSTLGMLAIPGNELSRHQHVLSLFTKLESDSSDMGKNLELARQRAGLCVLAHPGRYWKPTANAKAPSEVLERYRNLFLAHENLLGMEIINYENRYPHDRLLWDALLSELMPERAVWGLANDDAHSRSGVGRNWGILLTAEFSAEAAQDALRKGRFYFATITTHSRLSRSVKQTPDVVSVTHDPERSTIEIRAICGGNPFPEEAYLWIAEGKVIHRGARLHYNKTPGLKNYVRVELHGPGGTTFTQPFGFSRQNPN